MWYAKFFLVACLCHQTYAFAAEKAVALDPSQLAFTYQEMIEPFASTACKFEKANVGIFEWDVYCKMGDNVHTFAVHLVLSRYGRTTYGTSAYELLYWVTDRSVPRERAFDSTTLWVHLNADHVEANVFEISQGIENDLAVLRLKITL